MQFSDTTYGQGLVQEAIFFANADLTTYLINDLTRNINRWYATVVSDILSADGRWQWDDDNQIDLPRGTTGLFSGQQQYNFANNWLEVERVDIQDLNGNWNTLIPLDQSDIKEAYNAFDMTPGTPEAFDVDGPNIFLFPAPNYTQAASMKVFFHRSPIYFVPTDTTKVPGFAEIYHRILSMGAASDWCIAKDLSRYTALMNQITQMRSDLKGFYATRNQFEKPRIVPTRRGVGGYWNGDYT